MDKFYVYVLARPNGQPFYVGKGCGDRIEQHEREARRGHRCHKCNVIRKVWRLGGIVQRYIMLTTNDEAEALRYEQELIAMYRRATLANLTDGGEGSTGYRLTKAHKAAISAAQKRLKGKTIPPETREKLSKALMGRDYPQAWRDNISAALKGKARWWTGERHPGARMTQQQADEIRVVYAAGGITIKQLAAQVGVGFGTIQRIVAGQTFTDGATPDELRAMTEQARRAWNYSPRPKRKDNDNAKL